MSKTVPERYRHLRTFAFGDGPALADELVELVIKGLKTATCSTKDEPNTDERWVVVDGRGEPRCVIETTEVTYRRFHEVDAAFAYRREKAIGAWPIGVVPTGPISAGSDVSAMTWC